MKNGSMTSYEDNIPEQYRKNTANGEGIALDNLAETVTCETLSFLLIRLANESQNEEYMVNVLELAAKRVFQPTGTLLQMVRELKKNGKSKRELFRFLSVDELYSKSGPTEWVVKLYLDKGTLAMLFGKSGALKSFLAIDMGLSVATGSEWHGNPVSQGTVFYICGEGHKGIAHRVKAWENYYGINLNNVPFFVSNRPAQFLNEESAMEVVSAVNALCEQHGNPVLIIIDTLNRNFGDGDESNTADMTKFVHVIDTYLRLQFGCTLLIVHHTGLTNQDRARGAYSLHAALDWIYQAEKHNMILVLTNKKSKDFENLPSVNFKAEIITLDCEEEDGEAITSLILSSTNNYVKKDRPLTGANKIAYDALLDGIKKNDGKPIHIEVWRAAAYEAVISKSDKPDTKQKAFTRAKEYLHRVGFIEIKDDHCEPTPDTGQKEDI